MDANWILSGQHRQDRNLHDKVMAKRDEKECRKFANNFSNNLSEILYLGNTTFFNGFQHNNSVPLARIPNFVFGPWRIEESEGVFLENPVQPHDESCNSRPFVYLNRTLLFSFFLRIVNYESFGRECIHFWDC